MRSNFFDPFFYVRVDGPQEFGLNPWPASSSLYHHGGTHEVRNNPDVGATFAITLPTKSHVQAPETRKRTSWPVLSNETLMGKNSRRRLTPTSRKPASSPSICSCVAPRQRHPQPRLSPRQRSDPNRWNQIPPPQPFPPPQTPALPPQHKWADRAARSIIRSNRREEILKERDFWFQRFGNPTVARGKARCGDVERGAHAGAD